MTTSILKIGFDAKRIVRNGTGLGSYGRTLVNDLSNFPLELRLYAPDEGRADLRDQVSHKENIVFSVRKLCFLGGKTPFSALENGLPLIFGYRAWPNDDSLSKFLGLF